MDANNPKIKDLIENEKKYIAELIAMPDKVLDKKLGIVKIQLQMALDQKLFNEVDVLYLFQNMIIEARVKKNEKECETGIYEEVKVKPRNKKKAVIQYGEDIQTNDKIDKDEITEVDEQEPTTKADQPSLFNFGTK